MDDACGGVFHVGECNGEKREIRKIPVTWLVQDSYGWPEPALIFVTGSMDAGTGYLPGHEQWSRTIILRTAAIDLAVALAILLAVWFLSEFWIRERASRKGTSRGTDGHD